MDGGWTSVGPEADQTALRLAMIKGREVALARLDGGGWAAFDNSCPHEDCPLSDGTVEGDQIICYCHSSSFDMRTGEVIEGPAEEPLTMFPVRILDGELLVEVSW